ncbi:MAG: ribosomal protein L16, partial [Dehalococcoidia bacterium]|nr:ribosomal protein L16 [Dehalococcoidia bacterium]
MLQPKRVKYRKVHRGERRGKAQSGNTVSFGEFGLQAQQAAWVTARQIESARRVMV